jgi:hypothetical protein
MPRERLVQSGAAAAVSCQRNKLNFCIGHELFQDINDMVIVGIAPKHVEVFEPQE